jgi:hypothetical protein
MNIGDRLRKAAGLFVELPPQAEEERPAPAEAGAGGGEDDLDRRMAEMDASMQGLRGGTTTQPRTVDQIVRDSAGPNLDEITVPPQSAGAVQASDGALDFAALYASAGLPASPFTAEQTVEMLASLPQSLPLEMKRQTVQVTLAAMGKAIGATPESIVADTSRKLAALASYADEFTRNTGEFVAGTEADIAMLLSQVEEKRKAILEAKQREAAIQQMCSVEADRLDDVLEFFSLDVPPSRHAPPTG